jgi:hypothetical protein
MSAPHRNSGAPSIYVVPYRGRRNAPFMIAAFAGFFHDHHGADGRHEHNRNEDNY